VRSREAATVLEKIAEPGMEPDNISEVDIAPVLQILLDERVEARPRGSLPLWHVVLLRKTFIDQVLESWRVCGEATFELVAHLKVNIGDVMFDHEPTAKFVAILLENEGSNTGQEFDHKRHDGGNDTEMCSK
jgi:hypothetical protein